MKRLSVFFLFLILLAGCKHTDVKKDPAADYTEPVKNARHIVFIGLDGWGAYSLPNAEMPTVKEIMTNGSYSLKARNVLPSVSAPNWASMFSGVSPEIHGFTGNIKEQALCPPVVDQFGFSPTVFSVLREQKPLSKKGIFFEWPGISYLFPHDVMERVEVWEDLSSNKERVDAIGNYIKDEKPELLYVIFGEPDHVGHSLGYHVPEYYDKLKLLDTYIAGIRQSVIDAGIYDETVFILTADHGGIAKGHGKNSTEEREIPFIISGKNIKKNYQINSNLMIYDIPATIAYILNLKQPRVWIGRNIGEVFEKE